MIVLETPTFEIIYKVYFDKQTGNIKSISNVEQDIEDFFVADIEDVRPFLKGIKDITKHKVMYDVKTSAYVIVDKFKKIESDVNDNVYKILPQDNAQVIVSYNKSKNVWNVSLSDKAINELSSKKERIDQLLKFSITQKNNPNILHEYFTTTVKKLLDNPQSFDSQSRYDFDKFSVYTNRKFQKYSCEVVNE
jgi:hypothetical protein|tara:strand:- start:2906 stop:3481 length:576 start_codon:yes stop_codon:yes gene_type:complete